MSATVAIVGRPNVGKSSIFNRLVGRRQAIVHDLPGVTRDRIFGTVGLDDGRQVTLIDTGGLVPGDDPLGLGDQVLLAVEESDLLLMVVDGREGPVTADEKVWEALRRAGKPAILVVNKADTHAAQENFEEFYRLGVGQQLLFSAEHGLGVGELHEELAAALPAADEVASGEEEAALAIVGRPNVGKSSLLNSLLGRERALVSPRAGTTRDPIDTVLPWTAPDGTNLSYRLIDTAGIRRRSQVSEAAEGLAVLFARRQMERADAAVLVIDAAAGITSGDMTIAGQAWELGRAVLVAINKWDLLDDDRRAHLGDTWPRLETLLSRPPRVNISAHSGRRVDRVLPAVNRLLERHRFTLGTGEVNRFFERAIEAHHPPQRHGRPWKLFYATQVSTAPPTFMLFANRVLERADTYRRYLENRLREAYDLAGIPVRLVIRKR